MSKLRSQLNNLISGAQPPARETSESFHANRLDHSQSDVQLAAESLLPPIRPQENFQTASPSATLPNTNKRQDEAAFEREGNRRELAEIKSALQDLAQQLSQRNKNVADPETQPLVCNASEFDSNKIATSLSQSLGENLRDQMALEIDKMRNELGVLQQNANEANNKAVLDDIQGISKGIHDLQSRQVVNPDQFGEMASEVRDLHQDIRNLSERPQPKIDSGEIAQSIQQSYDEIAKRLDGIGSSSQAGQFEALSEKLEAIKNSISTGDPQLLSRIEEQLHGLSAGISTLGEISASGQESAVDALLPEYFEGLDRRMDEITRAVVAGAPSGNVAADEAAFDRIEARIASLAKSVENLSLDGKNNATDVSHLSDLLKMPEQMQTTLANLEHQIAQIPLSGNSDGRIDEEFGGQLAALSQKIDQLQLASVPVDADDQNADTDSAQIRGKLDFLATTLERAINSGDGSVGQLEERIAELSNRIDQANVAESSEHVSRVENETRIFDELRSLAARVELLDTPNSNSGPHGEQLSALENQIASLASQLQSVGGQPDFSSIEERLGGIEEQFAENLQSLSTSSSELKGHSLETFDAVRDSLSMILDRINSIEVRIASEEIAPVPLDPVQPAHNEVYNVEMVDAARDYASNLEQQNLTAQFSETTPINSPEYDETTLGAASALPQVDAPSLDLQHAEPLENFQEENIELAGGDQPLEPGSGAPDLAGDLPVTNGPDMDALMRQAKHNKRKNTLEDDQQNPTDFIAAARRAAQAAAQDEKTNRLPDEEATKPKQKFVGGKFQKLRKKPVMIGAAVLLSAALAIPALNYFNASEPTKITQSETSLSETGLLVSDEAKVEAPMQEMAVEDGQIQGSQLPSEVTATPTLQMSPHVMSDDSPADNIENQSAPVTVIASTANDSEDGAGSFDAQTHMPRPLTLAPLPPKEVGPIILRQAAASGDIKAQFEIGRRYTSGIEGTPDLKEAVVWYERSANSGYAPAQYRLGNFYEKGHGITSNVDKAASWYKKAATQGHALAMHNLAVINAMGVLQGGANMEEASTWFKMAAEHGVKDSQVNLGIVYAKAMGVDADLAQAYKWFAIAAKGGDKDAAKKRDTVAKQMRPDQLEFARGEVELWKPKDLNSEANTVNIPVEWSSVSEITASLTNAQMVQNAQEVLATLGFKPGPADGVMGAKTVGAIKEFQRRAGITVDGKVTPNLTKALENAKNPT